MMGHCAVVHLFVRCVGGLVNFERSIQSVSDMCRQEARSVHVCVPNVTTRPMNYCLDQTIYAASPLHALPLIKYVDLFHDTEMRSGMKVRMRFGHVISRCSSQIIWSPTMAPLNNNIYKLFNQPSSTLASNTISTNSPVMLTTSYS